MQPLETGTEATAIRDPLIGATVLGYEILKPIGVGGMGKVYEALERNIGRRAAVKVLLPEAAEQPDFVARLKAEARAANAARHRGIIDIFGFTELPDGRHAIVMEFLEGTPLDEELYRLAAEGRRMPTLEVLQVLDELASVLSAAHAAGVIHRDLKPSNIFLARSPDGSTFIKVLDFGIAKHDVKASLKTATNMVLGTPHYMAPEQAAAQPAAPSMDLYALGVIAFELFTGSLPFTHQNVMSLLLAHQQEAPPAPSSLNPGLPRVVDTFILKLLAKRPEDRFSSGAEIRAQVAQLRRVLGDAEARVTDPALGAPPTLRQPVPTRIVESTGALQERAIHRSPWPWVGAAAGLLALALATVAVTRTQPPTLRPESGPAQPTIAQPTVAQPTVAQPTVAPAVTPTDAHQPTPTEPIVAAPPSAPPTVAADAPTPPRPKPAADRRTLLSRRIKALAARVAKAEAAGTSMSLERQQLGSLSTALQRAPDAKTLDQVEVALQRLEEDVR